MPKNIVICCDGTNNQFAGDHTNVIRTYKIAVRSDRQVTFYDPGVGTMPEPWFTSKLGKRLSLLSGLAFGSGFLDNVNDAYRFLMEEYEAGDRVYLFGFSRGAYAARALAGMLYAVGLLRPGTDNLIPYASLYWRRHRGPNSPGGKLCAEFKQTMARECPVHFIGVWDTVGSVGFINHFRTFPFTFRNPGVTHVRHAVSIVERRCCFRQDLMGRALDVPDQDVKNVWFAGVHSDVGGGYPAAESGLAKIAFEWMTVEAAQAGLLIDEQAYDQQLNRVGEPPNPRGRLHVSLTGAWWLVEFLPTRRYSFEDNERHWRFSLAQPRGIARDAQKAFVFLHASVPIRMRDVPAYRPKNLPDELVAEMKIEPTRTPAREASSSAEPMEDRSASPVTREASPIADRR